MSDETSPEDEQSAQEGPRPPSGKQLDGLLGELDDHFGDRPPPPPPPEPRDPARGTPSDWIAFALAGAVVCAIAHALSQQWSATIRIYPFGGYELGPGTWGAIEGFVIGLQGGWACWAWQSVRAKRFNAVAGSILVLIPTGLSLIAFTYVSTWLLGSDFWAFEFMLWSYAVTCVGLLAVLYAHLGSNDLIGRLIGSYFLSQVFGLPIMLLGGERVGFGGFDFLWRANFPAYLALPLAWALLGLFGRDPFSYSYARPAPGEGEESATRA